MFRLLGWGFFAGAFLLLFGVSAALWLGLGWFAKLGWAVVASAGSVGPCAVHGGGGAGAVISLVCVLAAVLGSPASCWALVKLCAAVSIAIVLGSLPGALVWLALILRRLAKLASRGVSG